MDVHDLDKIPPSETNVMSSVQTTNRQEADRLAVLKDGQQVVVRTLADVGAATECVLAAMRGACFPEQDQFPIRLVMEEALVNAIKHGNRQDPARKVEVRYSVDADSVVVEIEDEGAGFDPEQVPDPLDPANLERSSGRGILLMRHYTTWMFHNAEGNCVTFGRRRSTEG